MQYLRLLWYQPFVCPCPCVFPQGVGQYPRIAFDVRECLLPPVPLGLRSTATFFVINNGYDNLELKYRLPADEGHLPMEVEFPEGTLIGGSLRCCHENGRSKQAAVSE